MSAGASDTSEPPDEEAGWTARLHWAVKAIPTDDPDLGFLASLLSFSIERGLSDRQSKWAGRILDRIAAKYSGGTGIDLARADMRGRA